MGNKLVNVLFVCSGNSARSIMAESILQSQANGRVRAFSAGSHPTGRVNPLTFEELMRRGYPVDGLSSKSWRPFRTGTELQLDVVIAVCEQVPINELAPWPGNPRHAVWRMPAPGAVQGSDAQIREAFSRVCTLVEDHVRAFLDELSQARQ
jgi:arsenate reductase